ncbi:MAG: hypothetical protein J0L84_11350, partial [Verrucomicrobia bacterium]|nr:hypothetical protein [Verrucomicrobiota bacterium]
MTASLLAAWWGPLIPIGMVVVAILYATLQAAARRKSWTDVPTPDPSRFPSRTPSPAPPPSPGSWGRGSPFP